MIRLVELNDLNLLDSIQVRVNERGDVSQEQRAILSKSPSLLGSLLKRLWSDVSYLGIFLIGLVTLVGLGAGDLAFIIYIMAALLLGIGLAVYSELPVYKKRLQMQDDIAGSRVKQALGTIVFKDETLQADIGERSLILPRTRNGLLPGIRYRFFYLDKAGIVLSAEKMESLGEEVEKQSYQEILLKANHFSQGALTSNRAGRLNYSLQYKIFSADLFTGAAIILGFAGISAYFFSIYSTGLASGDGGSSLSLACGSGSLLAGLAGLFTYGRSLIDLLRGKVMVATGLGRKAARMARRRSFLGKTHEENPIAYFYEVGDTLFRVKEPASNAFINDIRYNAYYTPLSKTLVWIEPLESPLRADRTN